MREGQEREKIQETLLKMRERIQPAFKTAAEGVVEDAENARSKISERIVCQEAWRGS